MSNNHIEIRNNVWCHTARPVRVFVVNGVVLAPALLVIFHIRLWTIVTLVVASVVLTWMESKGYSPETLLRLMRAFISGNCVSGIRKVGSRRIWRR